MWWVWRAGSVRACVFTPPPPSSRNHRSPQCLSQSWRVRLSECSQRRPCQRVLVPTSGLSGVRSHQPRMSLFLLCSCHREGMLSFYLTYVFAGCRKLCALLVSKFNVRFLKTQLFVFVGPGWNKNLYSAGAWGPELRTTTLNLKHTQTLTDTHPYTYTHMQTRTHSHQCAHTNTVTLHLQHKTLRYWRKVVCSVSGPEHQALTEVCFYFLCFRLVLILFCFSIFL